LAERRKKDYNLIVGHNAQTLFPVRVLENKRQERDPRVEDIVDRILSRYEDIITIAEAAAIMRVSTKTISRKKEAGEIAFLDFSRSPAFLKVDVREYMLRKYTRRYYAE